MMTLMALSLVIGILIDDAVVVRENIYRHMEIRRTSTRKATVNVSSARRSRSGAAV
jgi:hydrophobic/amphiphilic exporter-1 (mainly G- bacteria), HAE1 family